MEVMSHVYIDLCSAQTRHWLWLCSLSQCIVGYFDALLFSRDIQTPLQNGVSAIVPYRGNSVDLEDWALSAALCVRNLMLTDMTHCNFKPITVIDWALCFAKTNVKRYCAGCDRERAAKSTTGVSRRQTRLKQRLQIKSTPNEPHWKDRKVCSVRLR